jgi:hypothetical protein
MPRDVAAWETSASAREPVPSPTKNTSHSISPPGPQRSSPVRHSPGNHLLRQRPAEQPSRLSTIASYQGRDFSDIFSNINAFGLYINQTKRLNYRGLEPFASRGIPTPEILPRSTTNAISGMAFSAVAYPLHPTSSDSLDRAPDHGFRDRFHPATRVGWITSHYLTYVR